jgi:5'-methylthioadenosine phosphorylase
MRENADLARKALGELAWLLPAEREPVQIDTALDSAIVTPRTDWQPAGVMRLDAVMGRIRKLGT